MLKVNKCPTSDKGIISKPYTFGQVASINKIDSAAIKFANAIAPSKRRLVLSLWYAMVARSVIKTASDRPPTCKKMCTRWNPCKRCGIIIGMANIATTPATTIENKVDFFSSKISGRIKSI